MSDSWGSLFDRADEHQLTVDAGRSALDRRRASASHDGVDADEPASGGAADGTDAEGEGDDA